MSHELETLTGMYYYFCVLYNSNICSRCSCGCCKAMPTATESICCSEIDQVRKKREGEVVVDCISIHPGFQTVCLDVWVLQTAYFNLRQHYGSNAPQGPINQ